MNDRLRLALAWMLVAAIVFLGLLLLYYVAVQVRPPTDLSRPGLSLPVLQTIVAFALFDFALVVGLVAARLGAWPASLSARALMAIGAIMPIFSLVVLVLLDWPITLTGLLWTLVLIAGFALLLSIVNAWLVFRSDAESAQPTPAIATPEPIVDDFPAAPSSPPPAGGAADGSGDPMAILLTVLQGDRETAERMVALEKTLDPGATDRKAIARAAYRVMSGQPVSQ